MGESGSMPAGLRRPFVLLALAAAFLAGSCRQAAVGEPAANAVELTDADLARVAGRRILFGHQSVGMDILAGVDAVVKQRGAKGPRIVPADGAPAGREPAMYHFAVGRNRDPLSKLGAFEELLRAGFGGLADLALVKFCFVDVTASTDVDALFKEYRRTMDALARDFPGITFVHVTVPLKTVQRGPKAWLKKALGRPPGGYLNNAARNRYNGLLRNAYEGREPVFDLARIESTGPRGTKATFSHRGVLYEALADAYSRNGGHLNEAGQSRVASGLMALLARLPRPGEGRDPSEERVSMQ